ncbi:MAG: C1 family peptidase [Chitinophagales bacterium]
MKNTALLLFLGFSVQIVVAQQPSKAEYRQPRGSYYNDVIMPDIQSHENTTAKNDNRSFKVDPTGLQYPNDPSKYTQVWHTDPVSQGNTGTCWCFSTTSFFESEVKKAGGPEVKLSEMYTVYWQYVERARYFVEHRGDMNFGEGSETNGVTNMIKKYGAVPYDIYHGKTSTASFYNHEGMFNEMDGYLKNVKATNNWNEAEVVSTIRSILDHYMGTPPTQVTWDNKTYSPQEFTKNVLKLNMDNYIDFMSLMQKPFYAQAEYDVPDNWWNDATYYNLPVNDFMEALKSALQNGYSVSIGGDVSEPGWDSYNNVATVPTWDVSSENINDAARQLRFNNGATTDDHAMHLVGYAEQNGKTWFLFKDSGSGSRTCGAASPSFGYIYVSEDYVKLKMMTFTVNKNAVKSYLDKFASN